MVNPLEVDLAEKLSGSKYYQPVDDFYGDGNAAKKIVAVSEIYFK